MEPFMCCASVRMVPILVPTPSGRAESGVQPQHWMECRRHRIGPGSDEISRRQRTRLVSDNQTDLDRGIVSTVNDHSKTRSAYLDGVGDIRRSRFRFSQHVLFKPVFMTLIQVPLLLRRLQLTLVALGVTT